MHLFIDITNITKHIMSSQIKQIQYTHEDLLKLMLQDQDIHEGYWMLLVKFGFGAGNVGPSPDQPSDVHPTALVSVAGIGIERTNKLGPLVVDAALVNPKSPQVKTT